MKSNKTYFDFTIYKKTIARFWPLWAAYLVLWLIFLPMQGLTLLRLDAYQFNAQANGHGYMENFANLNVPGWAEGGMYMALFFGVMAAMAVFSHLYSARSANLFGSLPVRREGLFLTHYLAGLSFLLAPNAVVFLLTLLVEAAGGCVSLTGLLFWLAVICGECLFFYSLAVFCAMFTGHLLALPAFYAIVNMLVYGILELLETLMRTFYYGFAGVSDWVYEAAAWLTPVMKLEHAVRYMWTYPAAPEGMAAPFDYSQRVLRTYGLGTVGVYVLAGLALTACAFLLYRVRRLESAGDVVSVRAMRPVFKYGIAACAGMLLGYGTCWMTGGGESSLIVAVLFWAVAGYFGAQMLLDKSFRVFKKWKGAAAVAAAFTALFIVAGLDLTGYETRVPDPASVQRVAVHGLNAVYLHDDADSVSITLDDPDRIALITTLHRAAVDQRDGNAGGAGARLELIYELANGSTMSRDYFVHLDAKEVDREGSAAWCVERLYQDRELYWKLYGFDRLEEEIAGGARLDSAEYCQYDEAYGMESRVAGYGVDARSLLEAVKEDFRAGRIGVRTLTAGQKGDQAWEYDWQWKDLMTFRVADPSDGGVVYWLQITIQDNSTSTLAELDRLGVDRTPGAVRKWNLDQGDAARPYGYDMSYDHEAQIEAEVYG